MEIILGGILYFSIGIFVSCSILILEWSVYPTKADPTQDDAERALHMILLWPVMWVWAIGPLFQLSLPFLYQGFSLLYNFLTRQETTDFILGIDRDAANDPME